MTTGDVFYVVRRCGYDGLKAFRKLRCRVEPQLFGQLACSIKKLCKLIVNVSEDSVTQLGHFVDVMSSVANYGGAKFDPTTMEVLVTAMAAAAMVMVAMAMVVCASGGEPKQGEAAFISYAYADVRDFFCERGEAISGSVIRNRGGYC
ncbi:hypothetical protein CYMTET_17620 [Cymbomonas tetramitiformis]|uniref:Uncharacterized protein n=1 Tax=Cymbomonas tetramitiformis TaxID=36881 RepID=A0AAE0L745_9CHLO|nr:hypothetical protein CYMTET_17620 [Cymbomonas tetramitiformis]